MGDVVKKGGWAGFEIVYSYSRKQAIKDGVLVDLSSSYSQTRLRRRRDCVFFYY